MRRPCIPTKTTSRQIKVKQHKNTIDQRHSSRRVDFEATSHGLEESSDQGMSSPRASDADMPLTEQQKVTKWGIAREREWKIFGVERIHMLYQHVESQDRYVRVRKQIFVLDDVNQKRLTDVCKRLCLEPGRYSYHETRQLQEEYIEPLTWGSEWLDKDLLLDAFCFFQLKHDFLGIELADEEPRNYFSVLPTEIQLEVLDQLWPVERDRVARESFPHLLDHYIPLTPRLFNRWFESFCDRENLRYVGTWKGDAGVPWMGPYEPVKMYHTFRLRSMDHYPQLQIKHKQELSEDESAATDVPDLATVRSRLMSVFEGMYWYSKRKEYFYTPDTNEYPYAWAEVPEDIRHILDHVMRVGKVTTERRAPPLSVAEFQIQHKPEEHIPFLIPLFTETDVPNAVGSALLIYISELQDIFEELDIVMRPRMFMSGPSSLLPAESPTATKVSLEMLAVWATVGIECIDDSYDKGADV